MILTHIAACAGGACTGVFLMCLLRMVGRDGRRRDG